MLQARGVGWETQQKANHLILLKGTSNKRAFRLQGHQNVGIIRFFPFAPSFNLEGFGALHFLNAGQFAQDDLLLGNERSLSFATLASSR